MTYFITYILLSTIISYFLFVRKIMDDNEELLSYYFPWRLRKKTEKLNIIGCIIFSLILIVVSPSFFILELLIWIATAKYPVKKVKYNKSLYLMKKDFDEHGWKTLCESFEIPTEYNFIYCKYDADSVKEQQQYIDQYIQLRKEK